MKGDEIVCKTERGLTFYVTEENEADCPKCGERVLWCTTGRGKRMPVDPPDPPDAPTMSHFDTCVNGNG